MTTRRSRFFDGLFSILLPVLLAVLAGSGCSREVGPPPTLTAEQLPGALLEAFAKASPDKRELVNAVISSVKTPDYPAALQAVQTLSGQPGLTKEQSRVAASAMMTVNTLLQTAASSGDKTAAQTLKTYRERK